MPLHRGRRVLIALAALAGAGALAACGNGGERQDANEPNAEYKVDVGKAKFALRQRLAQTTDLELEVENIDDKTIPDLIVTITTDEGGSTAFAVRDTQEDLADPNRPVWVLEEGWPRLAGEDTGAGADIAQTRSYAFGPLEPGETKDMVWRVTPSRGGTYTVGYVVAAGTGGRAKAVTETGEPVEGEFIATIATEPPDARVNDEGEVEIEGERSETPTPDLGDRSSGGGQGQGDGQSDDG